MKNASGLCASARVALSGIAVCAILATGVAYGAESNEPVIVPVILPLTGPGAFLGGSERQSFEILEREANRTGGIRNRPLHFTFADDQGNPQIAVQLFSAAVASGAHAVLGGAFSATCKATAPLAEENRVVFYCLTSAIIPNSGGYVFSAYYYPIDLLAATLAYLRSHGMTSFAMLVGTDASGQEVDNKLDTMLRRPEISGLQVVAHEHFEAGAVSVAAQMTKIAAAHPQALVVWSATGSQTALRAMHDLGLDVPVALNPANMTYTAMTQFAGLLPTHLYFASGRWASGPAGASRNQIAGFFSAFKAAGIAPDAGSNIGWDTGWIVISALRAVGPTATGSQVHAYIEALHDFAGTNGSYDFRSHDQRGLDTKNIIVTEWSPAKNAWVSVGTR